MRAISFCCLAIITALLLGGCLSIGNDYGPKVDLALITSLRVATFNVRGPANPPPNDQKSREPRIRKIIEDNQFDLFGVQEAFREMHTDHIEAMPGYARIDGDNKAFKDWSRRDSIFYRTDRLELLDQGIFMLSETPEVPGSRGWDCAEARLAVWAKFEDKLTGKIFYFYNTHLDHVGKSAKLNGAALIVSHAEKNAAGCPVILTGDFNSTPTSKVYAHVSSKLKDAAKISETPAAGPDITFQAFGKSRPWYVDYIFVSSGINVLYHRIIDTLVDGQYPSDHFPVMAKIVLE